MSKRYPTEQKATLTVTHVCDWSQGECRGCEDEAHADAVRLVLSMRGRWLVVYDGGGAVRHRSRKRARGEARCAADLGVPARLIRYRRDRVTFDESMPQLEVNDARWLP